MRTVPVAFVVLALLAPPALAGHPQYGRCSGTVYEITADDPALTFYVVEDAVLANGVWFYQEANGVWRSHGAPGVYADDLARHNLQRGGASWIIPGDAEVCVDDPVGIGPDLLVF